MSSGQKNWIVLLTNGEPLSSRAFRRALVESLNLVEWRRIFCASAENRFPFIGDDLPPSQITQAPFERGSAWQALLAILEILRKDPEARIALLPVTHLPDWDIFGPTL